MTVSKLILNTNDLLSCRLSSRHNEVYSFELSGVSSINEIYHYIVNEIGALKGVMTLNLRNKTQGWSNNLSLRFMNAA